MTNPATLREEFINHKELAGDTGYCNPVMANKIADYWLEKMADQQRAILEKIERIEFYVRLTEGTNDLAAIDRKITGYFSDYVEKGGVIQIMIEG